FFVLAVGDFGRRKLALFDEKVRRLDVTVNDVCVVGRAEPLERVFDDRSHLGEGQVLLTTQALVEPLPHQPLEGDPKAPVLLLPGSQDGRDERRLDLLGDARLPVEAGDQVGILSGTLVKDLQGELLASTPFGGVNLSHSALTDQSANLVDPTDYRSRRE